MKLLKIKSISKKSKRIAVTFFLLGSVAQIALVYEVVPEVKNIYAQVNPPTVYTQEVQEETNVEKVEKYFQEEVVKLQDKYDQLLNDEARMKAIERVESEFEVTKQEIRGRELFISAPKQ